MSKLSLQQVEMLPSRLQQEKALIADVKSSAQEKHNVSR